jgi:hypothetical protein
MAYDQNRDHRTLSTADNGAAITPDDANDLSVYAEALYIGVTGDVKVDLINSGTAITFKAHPVGYLLAGVRRVYATGTTATNILALY